MCHKYSNCILEIVYKRDAFFRQLSEELEHFEDQS